MDYLCLSYAETFKKLSKKKQALLKVDLAKLFSDAELTDVPESSPAYSFVSSVPENTRTNTATLYSYCDSNAEQFIPQNLSNMNVFSNIGDTNISIHSDNAQSINVFSDDVTEQTINNSNTK